MRIRLFSACVLSACLASLASAQPSTSTLPPLIVPVPPATGPSELPEPPKGPTVVIDVQERPAPAPAMQPQPVGPAVVIQAQERSGAGLSATPPGPPLGPPPGPLPGQAPSPPPGPMLTPPMPLQTFGPQPGNSGRFWIDNEVLLWWIEGVHLPPLVSTSPPSTPAAAAGILGPTGSSIYGPGSQDNNLRFGYRLTLGGWLDDERRFALEANFLMTANGGNQFNAFSPGTPILAIPVINGASAAPGAEPIAVPGVANGSIHIATTTTGLLSTGIWLRENFTRTDDPCDTCHLCSGGGCSGTGCGGACDAGSRWYCRFDSLFGYRYMHLSDNLEIDDQVNAVAALNGVPAGATLQRADMFHTSNTFHGIDLGMTGDISRGPWTVTTVAKVAVGFNDSSIDINGFRSVGGVTSLGGLFAQATNIGHYSHTMTSAVPELDLKIGYAFRPNIRVYAGYALLYWYHVTRSADEINPRIDPAFLTSGVAGTGTTRQPSPLFEDRSIWMQGFSVGFEWRY
jgi:hypothetical protein